MNHAEIAARFNAVFDPGPGPAGRRDPAPTRLVGGAAEPWFEPAAPGRPALIRYRGDFAQSALHEIAHWCLAGPAGRRRPDYGLIYEPPPRGDAAQARFYAAEVPVQALEMLLARVAGASFHFSPDNPGAELGPQDRHFEDRVVAAFQQLCRQGPGRLAERVLAALDPDWSDVLAGGPRRPAWQPDLYPANAGRSAG